jgi:hypothetical protein
MDAPNRTPLSVVHFTPDIRAGADARIATQALVHPADGQVVDAVRVTVRGLTTKVPPPDLVAPR